MGPAAKLFLLLTIATFFEGYYTKLVSLVQPVIGREFGASREELGYVLGLSSLGMVFAFLVIHLADRVGRRPVFLGALAAYALLTLATAFSPNLVVYTLLQVFARMAMVVELGLAYLILSEEMPPQTRGRVNGVFGGCVVLGASVPDALLLPLTNAGIGWRGLFLIGALPLVLFPIYVASLKETTAFLARKALGADHDGGFAAELALVRTLFSPAHRTNLLAVTALWFIVSFWSATALFSFFQYAFVERGWTEADLVLLPLGTVPIGFLGYSLAGFSMDRFGRRRAAALYLLAGSAATVGCYQATTSATIVAGYFALVGLGGIWATVTTWTTELFPTELRATASGFANNLVGRLGFVFGPILVGLLGGALDSTADAVSLLGVVPLLGLPLAFLLPETNAIALAPADTRAALDGIS
jgi:putative MFS transporter